MTGTAQCERCGAPVELGSLFCARCGVDVTQSPDSDATVVTTGGSAVDPGPTRSTMRSMLREATLGEYEILDELGRGGMATVFRAHDISLDRKVAIKVMAPHLLEGEGMAERFKLEARTAAQLSHPHIIPIYAVKESASSLFFVMKFVEGRALDEIIARTGQLPIPMVKDILIKVGSALGYAHRRGVVHRDIKPGNIMIDDEGTPIVTDFGIAKVTETTGLTVTGTTIGTPSYMSPEQCEAKEVTGASDQYSLGIVAFQMLTARLPYEGDSAVSVMYKHCHEELPPLADYRPDCPPDVIETVTRMVAKDPADRWPSMEAAIQKLSLGSTSEAYLDPIRKELVKAAKEGDFERLAELSTGGASPIPASTTGGGTTAGPVEGSAAAPGPRRFAAVLATLAVLAIAGVAVVMQPWASDGEAAGGETGAVQPTLGAGQPATGIPAEEGQVAEGVSGGAPEQTGEDDASGGAPVVGGTPGDADASGADPTGGADVPAADPPPEPAGRPAAGAQPTRLTVSSVALSGMPSTLQPGETASLNATVRDQAGNVIPPGTVEACGGQWTPCGYSWASSDPTVASVGGDG
ncbi:MAG: protein kinase, partial [Longimicrobiales bacterium]|nr:protein kinase [Longimicrobiales bacterium]